MDDSTLDVAENVLEPNSAATVSRKCCIHIVSEKNPNSDVKEFNEFTLQKCQSVLAARRKFNMSYKNFDLPVSVNNYDCYHTLCYRKFTAIKKEKLLEISEADIKSLCYPEEINLNETETLASSTIPKISSRQKKIVQNQTTGILKKICIFCDKIYRYKNKTRIGLTLCSTKNFENNIRHYATKLNDFTLLTKILDTDFVAKEVCYHSICRIAYQKRYSKLFKQKILKGT